MYDGRLPENEEKRYVENEGNDKRDRFKAKQGREMSMALPNEKDRIYTPRMFWALIVCSQTSVLFSFFTFHTVCPVQVLGSIPSRRCCLGSLQILGREAWLLGVNRRQSCVLCSQDHQCLLIHHEAKGLCYKIQPPGTEPLSHRAFAVAVTGIS